MRETENHNLQKPDQGDTDWSHSPDMDTLEVAAPIRDLEANLGTYTPHDGARFEALDTEREFVGDGDAWIRVDSTGQDPTVDTLTFETAFRDNGRFEMVHLNTFNVGGDQKQAEVNLTISDYTDKSINKILLQCEHLSVHSADGTGDHTFAIQYNGYSDSGGYVNYRVDGTYTENTYAILTKQAPNNRPFLGRVWMHADQTFAMIPQGGVLTYSPASDTYTHTAAFNPNGGSPATIDSLRFFTPDADEIRMRRATVLGFSEGVND